MPRFSEWRMTPRALFRLLLALVLALAYAFSARAQEAPTAGDFDDVNAFAEDASLLPSSAVVQAALASINARNPESPTDFLRAVITLRRMEAYGDAQAFLDQAINANMDPATMVELHNAIGTAELVRLSVDTRLAGAREFVLTVFDAVKNSQRDPATLMKDVEDLSSNDPATRSAAVLSLSDAKDFAVPVLAAAMRAGKANQADVESLIFRIGKDAEEPLLAMLGSPDPTFQGIAARMLGPIGSQRAAMAMIRPYLAGTEITRRAAADYYAQLKTAPRDVNAAAAELARLAGHYLQGNPPVPADIDGQVAMWAWDAEQKNVVPYVLDSKTAGAVHAARLARDAYELQPTAETLKVLLVARLQVDQVVGGLDELLPRGAGSAYELCVSHGIEAVESAMRYATEQDLDAAVQGACEVLAAYGSASSRAWPLLTANLRHPNRRVRYAATQAMMAIDPRHAFTGSSYLLESLIDLANVSGTPRALVVMPRSNASDHLSGELSSLGFTVQQLRRSTELLRMASQTSDVDVIFLSDSVNAPTARETLQRLRAQPRTQNVPVVIMARQDNLIPAERIASSDAKTLFLPEFVSEQSLTRTLETAESLVSDIAVSPAQRVQQARAALGWISHFAQYSQTYGWYDIQRAESVALAASGQSQFQDIAIPLLGYLGGENAQQKLVQFVGLKTLTPETRQQAANAFTEAVARRGLMLASRDVYQQYKRYNASEQESLAVQEMLGQVLDVIETQTGSAEEASAF